MARDYEVEIMNINTREVILFKNAISCAEFFSVTAGAIRQQLSLRKINIPYKGYLLKRKKDDISWPNEIEIANILNNRGIFVTLVHLETGKKTTHSSITSAAKLIGVNCVYLHNKLKKDPNDPIKGYLAKRE